ncbi:MAG: aminotransferase [Gemmatales bacterium]|nr:MAG: aminotransferase [Gemmatales bacterium]
MPVPVHYSEKALRTHDQPITYFMQQAIENPDLISLAAGLVDPWSLPAEEVRGAFAQILSEPERAYAALQYGTTKGYAPLRQKLLDRLCKLDGIADPADISLTPLDVVVTTGSQQLLYLVSELLLDPGDLVITEAPAYFVYQGTLDSMGARTLSVPMDENGMQTDLLEELLDRLEHTGEIGKLRLIYVCDYFQNPTGLNLSLERRQHLLELVKRYSRDHRILILEDSAYRELRYAGEDIPSIKSLDKTNEFVILAMTFSKPCAPGLKTGYGFLPHELVGPLLRLKGNHDFGSNNLTQHLLDHLLETGAYDSHVEQLRKVYRKKLDALLEALENEFGGSDIQWTHPDGGLYVWVTFPPGLETGPDSPLMKAALEEGVLYVPGQFCYVDDENGVRTNEARLSFGVVPLEQIGEAVRRLAKAVEACTGRIAKATSQSTARC